MANIEADRAWMRNRAQNAALEGSAATARRDAAHRAEQARTCWHCFHDSHVIDYGGGYFYAVVQWCADPTCLCGVAPCAGCDERVRPTGRADMTLECPFCHHTEQMVAYA